MRTCRRWRRKYAGNAVYGEAYVFDTVGRTQTVTYTEEGTAYPFDYTNNALDTVDTLTYPTSTGGVRFALKSVYDSNNDRVEVRQWNWSRRLRNQY